jgi:outer membrane protein assembly factor BamE (lipoprotein component of BamABCDE complex)
VNRSALRTMLMCACGLAMCLAAGGCLVSSHARVSYGKSGPPVSDETLSRVEEGKTTKAWLLSVLGKPAGTKQVDDETEILTYEYTKKESANFHVLVLLGTSAKNEKHTRLYFEVRNDLVQRWWQEQG